MHPILFRFRKKFLHHSYEQRSVRNKTFRLSIKMKMCFTCTVNHIKCCYLQDEKSRKNVHIEGISSFFCNSPECLSKLWPF